MLKWIKRGEVVTQARMTEAEKAGLPDDAMARLWVTNTLQNDDVKIIEAAVKAAKPKRQTAKKEGE